MDSDRPRGILSSADREYLKNPDSISRQARYNRREAIVERTHEGLCDLATLKHTIPEELYEKIVSYEDDQEIPLEDQRTLYNRLPSSLAFIFLLLMKNNSGGNMSDLDVVEDFVASGVRKVYTERGTMVNNIDVSIDVDIGEDLSTLQERDNLTFNQARQMLEEGEITPEEFLDLSEEIPPGSGMGGMPGWTKVSEDDEE